MLGQGVTILSVQENTLSSKWSPRVNWASRACWVMGMFDVVELVEKGVV